MSNEHATTTEPAEKNDDGTLVFKGHLFRRRCGRGYVFTEKPPEPKPVHDPVHRPARVAQMLAFAHGLGAAIERGDFRDQADAARHFQLTRARITQLMNLTRLAPDLQEQVLFLEAVDGREPMTERDLRTVISAGDWAAQRDAWSTGRRSGPLISPEKHMDFLAPD